MDWPAGNCRRLEYAFWLDALGKHRRAGGPSLLTISFLWLLLSLHSRCAPPFNKDGCPGMKLSFVDGASILGAFPNPLLIRLRTSCKGVGPALGIARYEVLPFDVACY